MKYLKFFIVSLFITGCASPGIEYSQYQVPGGIATSQVEFWVHGFRNNDRILLGHIDPNNKSEMTTIHEIATLRSSGMFGEPTKSAIVDIPADEGFLLFYDVRSSSGYVSSNCSGILPLLLDSTKQYKIEVIHWTPKEATFAKFTCEFDINEVLADGSLNQVQYVKPKG